MRNLLILGLPAAMAMAGCIGTLDAPGGPKSGLRSASIDVIGAPGGHQVRNIVVEKPWPLCSQADASVLAEADATFIAAVKDGYVETWNKSIEVRKPALPKTPAQKARYNYYVSQEIRLTKDIQDNRYRYLHRSQDTQILTNPRANAEQRDRHLRATCIEKAYSDGHMRGSTKAEEDVRAVIEKAPPEP